MSSEQPGSPKGPRTLTPSQSTRVEFAHRDLDYARSEDLSHLSAAGLILLVEKLRARLDDTLNVVGEITHVPPSAPETRHLPD